MMEGWRGGCVMEVALVRRGFERHKELRVPEGRPLPRTPISPNCFSAGLIKITQQPVM